MGSIPGVTAGVTSRDTLAWNENCGLTPLPKTSVQEKALDAWTWGQRTARGSRFLSEGNGEGEEHSPLGDSEEGTRTSE